jgi:hypothetical protein
MRALGGSRDFATIYTATVAWGQGANPYDSATLKEIWEASGGEGQLNCTTTPSVYPPSTFLVLFPLKWLSWKWAVSVWLGLNLGAIVVILESTRKLIQKPWTSPAAIGMAAGFLALGPTSSAVTMGQTSLLVLALMMLGLLMIDSHPITAGLAFAIGACVKPQLAIPLICAVGLSRRWKVCLVAILMMTVLTLSAILRLSNTADWYVAWSNNLRSSSSIGGVNDPTAANRLAIQLINLQYALHTIVHNRTLVTLTVVALCSIMVLPMLRMVVMHPKDQRPPDVLATAALLQLIGLIAIYHRAYDAVILILPIAYIVTQEVPVRRAIPIYLAIGLFVLPGGVGVQALERTGLIPAVVVQSNVWQCFVRPYECWMLVVVASWLSFVMVTCSRCSISCRGEEGAAL